ncbi:metal-dependent hydrolase [Vibrio sp. SCSIO 43140]|uniref:metal-dependent hydrolase n=1 Tax=Vibrio sp. SCSIO 43140 TaxID=2819100 RepID=UPI00218654E1|nr:metal-dependent hydrolase [Vibrio sp. SCSIO 43140]
MQAINHQLTTASAYYIAMMTLPSVTSWMSFTGLGFAMLGALLPDIDTRHSRVGRVVPFLSIPIQALFGHRGALHSLLACALVLWGAMTLEFPWALSLTFGYVSHLIGDACTKAGVNFFWPLTKRYRVPLTPASNGVFEAITTFGCVAAAILVATR